MPITCDELFKTMESNQDPNKASNLLKDLSFFKTRTDNDTYKLPLDRKVLGVISYMHQHNIKLKYFHPVTYKLDKEKNIDKQ